MDVREGYKQTEVGQIPHSWEVSTIGDIGLDISDGNYSSKYPKSSDFKQIGVPFIRANNIKAFTVSDEDLRFISNSQHSELRKGHLKRNDILVTTRGEIGQVALVPERHIGSNINAQIVRFNSGSSGCEGRFIAHVLTSGSSRLQFENLQTGSALKQLPVGKFKLLKIPLPPTLAEQQSIAEALSDADALIESLEQLIAKKRQIKQGAMQELLTGKRRLPGFEGEWEINTLDNLLDRVANGFVYLQDSAGDVNVTRIETIASGKIDYARVGKAKYDESLLQYRLQQGDILFSHINSLDHIGKVARYNGDRPLYHGMNLLLLRVNKHLNDQFFYYWLCSKPIRALCRSLAKQAVSQASINTSEIKQIEISHPGVEEQSAIGQVLSEIDRDIELVEEKLSKARLLKQGMMQELLTGRIRLV